MRVATEHSAYGIRYSALGMAVAALLCLGGCGGAKVGEPLTRTMAGNEPSQQMDFWHTLHDRPVTSNDEAMHALLLLLDGEDPADTYEGRVQALKDRGILSPEFSAPSDEAVTRGTLAVAITRALNIRGGVMLRLRPFSPRYATRELRYVGLFPASSPHQTFSGADFVAIIGRVEDYDRAILKRKRGASDQKGL